MRTVGRPKCLAFLGNPFGVSTSNIAGSIVTTKGTASVTDSATTETLTVPISTDLTVNNIGLGNNLHPLSLHLEGQIVATRELPPAVPEPASLSLLALGLSGLLLRPVSRRAVN